VIDAHCPYRRRLSEKGMRMKLYFDDLGFDLQLQRSVGKCDVGMANVGD
jgi:hypothetical protein